jgi:hypothetical protein
MSQQDVLEFLVEMRCENDDWYRIKDIQKALSDKGLGNGTVKGVAEDCLILVTCNNIEMRGVGLWSHYKEFRGIIKSI